MTAVTRLGFLAALGLALSACPPQQTTEQDAGPPTEDCFEDSECPDPNLFFCNTATSKCEPSCRTKADCTADVRGEFALDYCASNLGCQCDEGKCVGSLCSSDLDCGSQVCRNGACVAPPAAATVDSCKITPDLVVLKAGAKAKFWVSAWAGTTPVVTKEGATWSATNAAVTGSGTGFSAEFTAATTSSALGPVDAVQAVVGGASCKAQVIVLPGAVPAGSLDVVVTDELSGRPIQGASVMASVPTTGNLIGSVGTTDDKGYARLTIPGGNSQATVSVFHNDFNYLTIANYDLGTSSADARFLSFVLRRNQVDKYGGYKGTFNNVPNTSNVQASIAGMSLAGSITDLSVSQLLGPSEPTHVKIGTAIDKADVPLPAGTYLGFAGTPIKTNVSAQGLAGVCDDAGKTAAGTCGTRTAWALSGDVPLGDLPIDAFVGGTGNIDFGKVLGQIIPIFRKFNSSIVRDVVFDLKPTPRDGVTGEPNFTDTSGFTTVNHDFAPSQGGSEALPLAFNFVVRSPDLPKFKGSYADGVLLLGGAVVPGRGVVPLGMGAAVNTKEPVDAKTDPQAELNPGLVQLRMAPTHHGIEGSDYAIVALALSLKSATDASAGVATSGIVGRLKNNQLVFDPKGNTVTDLPGGFLSFPENTNNRLYNFTNAAQGALGPRTFKFAADPGLSPAAGVYRVVFTDRLDHRWVVYLDTAQATTGFTLPTPPGTFADRTFHNGNTAANDTRSSLLVQALRLNDNPTGSGSAVSMAKFVEFNSTNGDRLTDFTTGFSFIDFNRPEVVWVKPETAGATVSGSVTVKVSAFRVGTTASDDGYVRVSFTGGNSSCVPVEGRTDASQGKGEIAINLPSGCAGTNVELKAELYGTNDQPVAPPVSSTITATIQ